jgi:hypothetical protein
MTVLLAELTANEVGVLARAGKGDATSAKKPKKHDSSETVSDLIKIFDSQSSLQKNKGAGFLM